MSSLRSPNYGQDAFGNFGGTFIRRWLLGHIKEFPDLEDMSVDDGFFDTRPDSVRQPLPDARYDLLEGEARLRELERILLHGQAHWAEDTAERAKAWLQKSENAPQILSDFESLSETADDFPQVWSCFLWWHEPPPPKPTDEWPRRLPSEADRVLHLLSELPEAKLSEVIWGVSQWLWHWRRYVMLSERGFPVWLRAWPIAVETTNAVARKAGNSAHPKRKDEIPVGVDGINLPSGKLIEVFLASCPSLKENSLPFADDSLARRMRDLVVAQGDHSGLIARCQLVKKIPYLLRADPDWTRKHLIEPLLKDDSSALWSNLAPRGYARYLLEMIGGTVLKRCTDGRLGRRTRESLVSDLVTEALNAFQEGREPAVPNSHISQMLRSADDETREFAAGAVRCFHAAAPEVAGCPQSAGDLFHAAVKPFFQRVWPKERDLSTPDISRELSHLPAASGEAFAEAVEEIKRFLVPFDCWSMLEYGLYGEVETADAVIPKLRLAIDDERDAVAFLDLLALTIGEQPEAVVPYDLSNALDWIKTLAPNLVDSPAFRRLAATARRQR